MADADLSQHESHAADVLAAGLPFALTHHAAVAHVIRCDQALHAVGPEKSLVRVKLLASRAVAMTQSHDDGAANVAREALDMANWLDCELGRGYGLTALALCEPLPHELDERLAAAREALAIASRRLETALVPAAYHALLVALLEKGEIRSLDLELTGRGVEASRFLASQLGEAAGWFRCLRTILDGDTELAERLVTEQYEHNRLVKDSDAFAVYTSQLGVIGWMRGEIDGVEERFTAARREHPEQVVWAASLAWLWLGQGRTAAAQQLFCTLQDLSAIPRDRYWLSTVTVLAEIATRIGPRPFAEELRATLLPFAHQLVPLGVGVAFWGTCARTLGLLEESLGLLDDARTHLELAVELTGRIGAQAWLAEAQIELAEFAIRHELGDIPAYELLAEARATSAALGFRALHARSLQRPRIRVLGHFEVVSHDGVRAEWTSRKARDLLKMVVAARGRAVSREVCMDALWPDVEPRLLGNRFSVAVNTIRRALDPGRTMPRQHHFVVEGDSVRLDLANVDVDLERFHALAARPDEASRRTAREMYRGGAFTDEPYADWAVAAHNEAARTFRSLSP